MINIRNTTQLTNHLNAFFKHDLTDWMTTSRQFFRYDAQNRTGIYAEEQINYPVIGGVLGFNNSVLTFNEDLKTAIITTTSSLRLPSETRSRRFALISEIKQYVDETGQIDYIITQFNEFTYNVYLGNMAAIKTRHRVQYNRAVSLSGFTNPTDDVVARTMATIYCSTHEQVPEYRASDVTHEIIIENLPTGKQLLKFAFSINGKQVEVLRSLFYNFPTRRLTNVLHNPNEIGDTIYAESVIIDNNLNNRADFIVMSTKQVRIDHLLKFKLVGSDQVYHSFVQKVVDFNLEEFAYFELL